MLCVCGLAAEARIVRRAGLPAVVGAGDRRRLESLVEASMARIGCVVSFGIAGGLSPALRPGDLVLSEAIVSEEGVWRGDESWRRHVAAAASAIGAKIGLVLGVPEILATPAEKVRAYTRFAALAVDLESDVVAQAATRAGIRFAALRAIADPAGRALPSAALLPLISDGRPDLPRVFGSLLREPRQAAALIGVARETRIALQALSKTAPVLLRLSSPAMAPRPPTG